MRALKQTQLEILPAPRKVQLRWEVLFKDLILLFSLFIARFLVWRTLRRERKEREFRRKRLHLIQGTGYRVVEGSKCST
jgi:hypothetical protein